MAQARRARRLGAAGFLGGRLVTALPRATKQSAQGSQPRAHGCSSGAAPTPASAAPPGALPNHGHNDDENMVRRTWRIAARPRSRTVVRVQDSTTHTRQRTCSPRPHHRSSQVQAARRACAAGPRRARSNTAHAAAQTNQRDALRQRARCHSSLEEGWQAPAAARGQPPEQTERQPHLSARRHRARPLAGRTYGQTTASLGTDASSTRVLLLRAQAKAVRRAWQTMGAPRGQVSVAALAQPRRHEHAHIARQSRPSRSARSLAARSKSYEAGNRAFWAHSGAIAAAAPQRARTRTRTRTPSGKSGLQHAHQCARRFRRLRAKLLRLASPFSAWRARAKQGHTSWHRASGRPVRRAWGLFGRSARSAGNTSHTSGDGGARSLVSRDCRQRVPRGRGRPSAPRQPRWQKSL